MTRRAALGAAAAEDAHGGRRPLQAGRAGARDALDLDANGILIRRLPGRNLAAGTRAIAWNGRFQNGRLVYRGSYVFKVFAQNAYGPVDLSQIFVIRR